MEYIFEKWEKKLSDFKDNVESELSEIRKCKAEMQQMQLDLVAKIKKGHYVYDPECLVLSAPKIIIGHVDQRSSFVAHRWVYKVQERVERWKYALPASVI